MKTRARMIRRLGMVFVALGFTVWLGGGWLLAAPQGNNAADPDLFLIGFRHSSDLSCRGVAIPCPSR